MEVNNDQMTGETLYHYILKCAECILTGDMPMPKDLSDVSFDLLGNIFCRTFFFTLKLVF